MDRRRRFHSLKKLLNKSLRNGESVTILYERGNEVFRHNVAVNAVSDTELSVLKALSLTRLGRPCTVRIFGEQFRVEVTLGGLLIGRGDGPYRRTAAHVPFIRVEDVSGTDVTAPNHAHVSVMSVRDPEPAYGITLQHHECASNPTSTPLDQTARHGLHTTVYSLQQISRADAIRHYSADSTEPLCHETPDNMSVNGGDYLSSSSNSSISSNNSSSSNTNNSSSSNNCNSMIGQCGRHLFIVCSRSKYTFFIDGYDFEERHLIETIGKIRTLLPE